ncbi:MAG TPA: hypothetical protein VMC85_14555 [Desulfomonilaceae bacterium]|nr:hypothetical protein [Desulfomonilaceae bacterium]
MKVAELLSENGVDEVRTRMDLEGKGAGYALEAQGMDAFITEAVTLKKLLSQTSKDGGSVSSQS